MRQEGLEGIRRGKTKRTTTPDEAAGERARDLVQCDFSTTALNESSVVDITYPPHLAGLRTWPSSSTSTAA